MKTPLKVTSLITLTLLACLAVFFSVTTPAGAGNQVPFKGTVYGEIPPSPPPPGCLLTSVVTNHGNATHIGAYTGTGNLTSNVCDGSYSGTSHWIAANGDTISSTFFGQLIPTATPGVFDNVETTIVTGGTGRFAGASGMTTSGGQVNFNTGTFALPFSGTISSVGSN